MFLRNKKHGNLFLIFLLLSLLIHSPLVFLSYKARQKSKKLVLVKVLTPNKQNVSQKEFNQIKPRTKHFYLSKENQEVEKQTQTVFNGLFQQSAQNSPQREKNISDPIAVESSDLADKTTVITTSAGLNTSMDFLPEIEKGSHTILNTQELTYYSFYQRITESISFEWINKLKEEQALSIIHTMNTPLFSTYILTLLSPTGEVEDIMIVKSSGEEIIDNVALEAILSAAPFPNPPQNLVKKTDGYIHLRRSFHIVNKLQKPSPFSKTQF